MLLKYTFFFALGLTLLLGAGCATASTNPLPSEFWAYGTWRFDEGQSTYTVAPKGVAFVTLHFSAQTADQYLVDGKVTYDDTSFSCTTHPEKYPNVLCRGVDYCTVTGTTDGELTGVAVVQGGVLRVTQQWLTKPDESVTWTCNTTTSPGQSAWAVWLSMNKGATGFVETPWTVDIADASFVDDLPTDTVTDTKTITATFEGAENGVTAQGILGFYRALPASE